MAVDVIMPKAGMAMEEGTIIKWLKKEGDKVETGEPLLEITTDKVNMEVESIASGTLLKIVRNEGEVVPVTHVIAYIGEPGEKIEAASAAAQVEKKEDAVVEIEAAKSESKLCPVDCKVAATPLAKRLAKEKGIDLKTIQASGSRGQIRARDVEAASIVKATPLAKRIAEAEGIDLSAVKGSGFGGKVRKEDIVKAPVEVPAAPVAAQAPSPAKAVRKPLKGMRKVIAERMLKSHLEAPPVTMNAKADVTELVSLRAKLNEALGMKISFNDFILKAVAIALKESPNINASIEGNEIVYKEEINVGMAVALDEGLIVPVIKNADTLSLKQISLKAKELAGKARDGKLLPDDYTGGTFSVSNLGMYDILSFTPILNPPESAILGVCAIENELKMVGERIEKRSMMGLSLTIDHRLIDGAQGAIFLKKIKELLEKPLAIMA